MNLINKMKGEYRWKYNIQYALSLASIAFSFNCSTTLVSIPYSYFAAASSFSFAGMGGMVAVGFG